MISSIYDVLRRIRPELDDPDNDPLNYTRWKSICGKTVSMDRRMAKYCWDILLDQKVFIPINGKAYRVNHDKILQLLSDQKVTA